MDILPAFTAGLLDDRAVSGWAGDEALLRKAAPGSLRRTRADRIGLMRVVVPALEETGGAPANPAREPPGAFLVVVDTDERISMFCRLAQAGREGGVLGSRAGTAWEL